MGKKISEQVKNNILSQLLHGKSSRIVAKSCRVGKTVVQNIAKSNEVQLMGKKGRPKILTQRDEKMCMKKITSGEAKSAVHLTKILNNDRNFAISRKTVARALNKQGLKAGEKKKKPDLSQKNIKARLEFANKHSDWTEDDWNRVIFSDESKINRFNSDGRSWCWFKNPGELNERTVKPQRKFGGGGVMIWGCMTSKGVGFMCKIDGNMDQELYKNILQDDLHQTIEYYEFDPEEIIFQHDNDPKHKAKSVQNWLYEQEFSTMEWPAQSPDLNPIEHLWSEVKRKLNQYEVPPKGVLELWERIQKIWNEISLDSIKNLYNSMPRRIEAVIEAKGKWTKY